MNDLKSDWIYNIPAKPKRSPLFWTVTVIIMVIIFSISFNYLFIGKTGPQINHIAGSCIEANATSQNTGYFIFGSFTWEASLNEIEIYIYANGSQIENSWTNETSNNPHITFLDDNNMGILDRGDKLELTALTGNTTYSFRILHLQSGEYIQMTGLQDFTTDV